VGGPFIVPIAPTADAMSGGSMSRGGEVEALKPCSAPTMKYASSARAVPASGRSPFSW
jgi:hypothetical protein